MIQNNIHFLHKRENNNISTSYLKINFGFYKELIMDERLKEIDILQLLLAMDLAKINASQKKGYQVSLPAGYFAKTLNCSTATIFRSQQNLKKAGYCNVLATKGSNYKNLANLITFADNSPTDSTQKNQLFFNIPRGLYKQVITLDITPFAKILWIELYSLIYANNMKHKANSHYCWIDAKVIAAEFRVSVRTVQRAILALQDSNLISFAKEKVKRSQQLQDIRDKPIYHVSLIIPEELQLNFTGTNDKTTQNNNDCCEDLLEVNNSDESTNVIVEKAVDKNEDNSLLDKNGLFSDKFNQHNIKKNIIKEKISYQKIENNLSDNPPREYTLTGKANFNNIKEKKVGKLDSKPFAYTKGLVDFHPIGEEDADLLRQQSGREFTTRAINQILLSLANKFPAYSFLNKRRFIRYMTLALINEKREATQTTGEAYVINNALTIDEALEKKAHQFLEKVEQNYSRHPVNLLKRHIAATLPTIIAYQLLYSLKSMIITDNGVLWINTSNAVQLSDRHKELIHNQATYLWGDDYSSLRLGAS